MSFIVVVVVLILCLAQVLRDQSIFIGGLGPVQNVVVHKLFYDEKLIRPKLFSIPSLIGQQLFLIIIFSNKKKIKEQLEKPDLPNECICTRNQHYICMHMHP